MKQRYFPNLKKFFTFLFVVALFCIQVTNIAYAQCPAGFAKNPAELNSPGYPTNTALENNTGAQPAGGSGSGHFGFAQLNGLFGGTVNFRAELVGPSSGTSPIPVAWRNFTAGTPAAGGVQIQPFATPSTATGSTYLYLQPADGDNPVTASPANYAKYTMDLLGNPTNLSFVIGGLNNLDMVDIKAYYKGVQINLATSNFTGLSGGVTATDNGNDVSLIGSSTTGAVDPLVNTFTANIPGPVDKIEILSGKSDNSNSTVTIGLYSVSGCYPDRDGDGVIDLFDLDNDNDGILDSVECKPTIQAANGLVYQTGSAGAATALVAGSRLIKTAAITYLGKVYDLVVDITGKSASPNVVSLSGSNNLQFGGDQVGHSPYVTYDLYFVPTGTGTPTGTLTPSTIKDVDLALGDIDGLSTTSGGPVSSANNTYTDVMGISNSTAPTSITLGAALNPEGFQTGGPAGSYTYMRSSYYVGTGTTGAAGTGTFLVPDTPSGTPEVAVADATYSTFTKASIVFGVTDQTANTIVQTRGQSLGISTTDQCDTDGDGIPDQFDLDSDGDGCPDAIEGGSTTITSANLVTSTLPGGNSGTGYTGTSTSPVTSNLGNTVDANGVPTIAAGGQSIGSSNNPAVNACQHIVSGNVFNDANGLTDNTVNGTTSVPSGMVANLVDKVTGKVVATVPVTATGTYSFPGVNAGTYNVQLTTTAGTVGAVPPATTLPTGWLNTGETIGTVAGSDGTVNGLSPDVVVSTADVTNVNFGIEQPPTANIATAPSQVNPGGTIQATVPASSFGGTDPTPGTVDSIRITTFPTGAQSIVINGVSYTVGTWPTNGVTVKAPGGVPAVPITVDPAATGATSVVIPYVTIDNAHKESITPGSVTVPFTAAAVNVSGNVFNDANGLTDNTVNGLTTVPTGLNANLIDSATGKVIATVAVSGTGTYTFTGVPSGTYAVQLSTNAGTVGSLPPATALPTGWVNTGENNSAAAGSDGTVNGMSANFPVVGSNVTNINFGIEQPPTASTLTAPSTPNPGGTTFANVPPATFGGTDPTPGTVDSIRITAFPSNAQSIKINGVTYNVGNFPAGGVTVVAPGGVPAAGAVQVDPVDGTVSVVIPYVTKDNAGKESLAPGSATVPFTAATISVGGNVFNDANGLTDNTVNGTGTNAGGLNANLLDASGNVVATVPVNASGVYNFPTVTSGAVYTVQVTTVAGTVGSPAPATTLPTGWVNTGENNGPTTGGTATGSDGTINGKSAPFTAGATNITDVNFGIEQPPTANTTTAASQVSPNGVSVALPSATFGGTDPTPGTVDSIRITSFPTNAVNFTVNGTTYTAGTFPAGGVTIVAPGGVPPVGSIAVTPTAGAVTVTVPYVTKDNAGKESLAPGAANFPFTAPATTVTLKGNVYNDANGLQGTPANTVDGTGTNVSGALNANLIDATGHVIATTPIGADGTYSFPNVPQNATYTVQVSTNAGTVGGTQPATALPAGWVNTGENIGSGAGSDGTPNGLSAPIVVTNLNVDNINFGIEQPPTANTTTAPAQVNPGGTISASVPPATFGGTDPTPGTIDSIRITAFPSNATSITINGTTYTSGTFPAGGVTVVAPGGQPGTGVIKVDPVAGAVIVPIPYVTKDNAGKESVVPGVANVPFTLPTTTVSGNVFNDANGLTDNNVNGTTSVPRGMNANLLDPSGNVVATIPINPDGTYTFPNVNDGNYTVQLTTNAGTVGSPAPATALPTGWVNTGENNGVGTGSDGTVNGVSAPFTVAGANVTNINFGIEQPPTANITTAPSLVNPGGTTSATVPSSTFGGTDPAPGTVDSIKVTSFPSNATSITINGTTYTSGTFPAGGVSTLAPGGVPTTPIQVDPVDGAVVVGIPYVTIDNAGKASLTPGLANQPFTTVPISGKVFDDANGLANGGTSDLTGTNAGGLNAILVDGSGNVVATTPVNADGTYSFPSVIPGNYTVELSTSPGTVGSTAPAASLPTGWVNTGEGTNTTAGDGTINGSTPITVPTTGLTGINFGIEQPPVTNPVTQVVSQPVGGSIPAGSVSAPVVGTDPEDGTLGNANTITITSLADNGTASYNGSPITVGQVITGFNPALLSYSGLSGGTTSSSFGYSFVDAAGKQSATPSTYKVSWPTVLAVNLISFTANPQNGNVTLNWTVGQEINVAKYQVEYSKDGSNFVSIGALTASGNKNYSFINTTPVTGLNYYRLKTIDKDGTFSYSLIRSVNFTDITRVVVFPNPARSIVNVTITSDMVNKPATIMITSMEGKTVFAKAVGLMSQTETIDVSNLVSGQYILRIVNTDKVVNTSIQVMR